MQHFRQLGDRALESANASLIRLMYGITPTIRLESMADRISNMTSGYSFVQDPTNELFSAYLNLSSRACLDPMDGLMFSERWNLDAVHRYLKEEAYFLTQLMLVMHLRGGQAPRSPELFSLECCNGPSTSRGVYIHEASIMYVTRHSKAKRSTNQEFHVARYLPRPDSELMATYLVYVRPFVEMLRRACYGGNQDRRLLFSSPAQPDVPWKVDGLTKALKKLT